MFTTSAADIGRCMANIKKDGILIYSTCSYSKEEDEDIMDWITDNLSTSNIQLEIDDKWGITETISIKENHGYRFWPDKVKGEGFFLSCFQKRMEKMMTFFDTRKPEEAKKLSWR